MQASRTMNGWAIGRGLAALGAMLALLSGCSGGGGGGGGGSSPAVAAPTIVVQPQSVRVGDGQPATFSVTVTTSVAATYQWTRNGAAIAGANAASYRLASAQLGDDGASFAVVVSNAGGSVQSASATLNVSPVAPAIVNVATTVSVVEGQPATFTVTATGSAPLTFQWRRSGVAIAGATSPSYRIPAAQLADNGATFDVVVTNAAGSATSAPFTLTVTSRVDAPTIAIQPQSQSVRTGDPATFTVVAAGTSPFTYQWLRDGAAIPGAQAPTYTIAATTAGDNGAQFSVVVTNAAGSATSAVATLAVTPQPSIALLAGNVGGPGSIDATGTAARFVSPAGIGADNAGNLYVGDSSTVRRIDASGAVTSIAGSPTSTGSADGVGAQATFRFVGGVAVDGAGNVFVTDTVSGTVRRITPAGAVTTIAGTAGITGSSDGVGAAASFNNPVGVAIDGAGNLYVADTGNHTIRKITPAAVVTTLAGSPGAPGAVDGSGAAARFNAPRNVAVDAAGSLYVADTGNNTIRVVDAGGLVSTLAGTAGANGTADGVGAAARFSAPAGIAIDPTGVLYVADVGALTLRRVTRSGAVTSVAGAPGASGSADGTGAAARFALPLSLAADASGAIYVADRSNFAVRKVTDGGVVSTFAGASLVQGSADGAAASATFNDPYGVAVDRGGNVFVTDYFNGTIRRLSANGVVTTLAGTPGAFGSADGAGTAARFATPQGVAIDAAGNLYVADKSNQTIRKVTPAGLVGTLAGSPSVRGSVDGTGAAASFDNPSGVAVDAAGNVYVVDNAPTVRKITPAGVVTTLAGAAGRIGAVDGPGNVASFNFPQGVAVDAGGNVYVADSGNGIIRKITPAGLVSTVAGLAGSPGSVDGTGAAARFTQPTGVAIDRAGNVYVSDFTTHTIRRIDGAGNVTTVAGVADGRGGVRLGSLPGHLDQPVQIAFDPAGNLICVDVNGVLRIVLP